MTVLIEKNSPFFDRQTAGRYFELNRANLDDANGFEKILAESRFFNIYNRGYVGSVFIYTGEDGKNYIGGYAKRKHHHDVLEAIRRTTGLFDEVYAHTRHPEAAFALRRAGFEWFNRENGILRKTKYKEKNDVK